jgi:arylsulfatase A-like enzyme
VLARRFENGLVILNGSTFWPAAVPIRDVDPSGDYRRIRGTQDPSHNNGETIDDTVRIAPQDAIFLVRQPASPKVPKSSRPNIVLILADDLGYGDTGCYGATKVKTPAIDRLAVEGMRFADAYAPSPVCCPTRYALLSGIYPWRVPPRDNFQVWATHASQSLFTQHYPVHRTLASHLKEAGYATGAVGKWHVGLMNEERDWSKPLKPGPLEAGFDWFFGDASNRYKFYIENHRVARIREDDTRIKGFNKTLEIPDSVWRIDFKKNAAVLNDRACAFIRQNAGDRPFFLYYCPNNVHTPLTPGADFQGSSEAGAYGDFVQELDWTVGEMIKTLGETGELDDTLIIFSSDNGGRPDLQSRAMGHRTNAGLLGQKTDVWEGGIRVPFVVRWPGVVPAGTTSDQVASLVDLLPTLAEAINYPLTGEQHCDGMSLLPVLKGGRPSDALAGRAVAGNVGNRGEPIAVRKGDWLYVNARGSGGVSAGNSYFSAHSRMYHSYADLGFENSDINPDGTVIDEAPEAQLYNLKDDPAQKRNVIREHPDKTEEMKAALASLRGRVDRRK